MKNKLVLIIFFLMCLFGFKIETKALVLRSNVEFSDADAIVSMNVYTMLSFYSSSETTDMSNGFFYSRKFAAKESGNNVGEVRLGYFNGDDYKQESLGAPFRGYNPNGAFQMKYDESAGRADDINPYHVCIYKDFGTRKIDILADTADTADIVGGKVKKFMEKCASFSEGHYYKLIKNENNSEIEEVKDISNKITCNIDGDSSVSFRVTSDPSIYIEEVKGIGELAVRLQLDYSLDVKDLFTNYSEGQSFSLFQWRKIDRLLEFGTNFLGAAAVTLLAVGLAPAAAGVSATAGILSRVASIALKTVKFAFKAGTLFGGVVAGGATALNLDKVAIVDCGSGGTPTCLKFANIISAGTSTTSGACYISDDAAPDWTNISPRPITCSDLTNTQFYKILSYVLKILRAVAVVALIIFGVLDFLKAVVSSDAEALKKSGSVFVKRIILTIFIFFVPAILELLLSLINLSMCS